MTKRSMGWRSLAAALALATYAGCSSDQPPGGGPTGCATDADCGGGSVCLEGFCVVSGDPADAGEEPSDAGAGETDAGLPPDGDAGLPPPDTTPPTIEIEAPKADEVFGDQVTVRVKAADDGSGVAKVEASFNGIAWNVLTLDGASFTATLPLAVKDDVRETLTVRAFDNEGNEAEASVQFVNDGVAPGLTLTPPGVTSVNRAQLGGVLEFRGTATDGSGVVDAEYSLDQTNWTPVTNPSDFTVKYAIPDQTELSLVLYFRATDKHGNATSPVLETAPIRIDTINPTWSFSAPADGHVFTLADPAQATVQGSSTDTDIASVELRVDGSSKLTAQSNQLSYNLLLADEDSVPHQLQVRITDAAGNSATFDRSFKVDRVAPQVAITSPSRDYDCSGPQCLYAVVSLDFPDLGITGTASDGAGLAASDGVTIAIGSYASGVATRSGPPNWSYTWTNLPSPDGEEVAITATATDANGNSATAVRKLWVDRVAPKATALVDNARRVVRTEALIGFDEPMDVSTVKAASGFYYPSTAVPLPISSFGSTDGRQFRLSVASELDYHTAYSLVVGSAAMDKSGNRLGADVAQKFQTEGVAAGNTVALKGAKPLLFVDPDGNPIVFHHETTNNRFAVSKWDGKSAYARTYVINNTGFEACDRAFSVVLSSAIDPTSLGRSYVANVLHCQLNTQGNATLFHSRSNGALTFGNTQPEQQFVPSSVATLPPTANPSLELAGVLTGPITVEHVPRTRFLDVAGNLLESVQSSSTNYWSDPPPQYMPGASGALHSESAFAHSGKLFYAPTKTEVSTLGTGETFTAISGHGRSSIGTTTPGHLLWALQNGSSYGLRAACAQNPVSAANWKLGTALGFSTTSRIERVEVRVSNGRVLYAVQTANDQVHYASHTDAGCAAAPASLTWTRISGAARRPSIDLDRNDRTGAEKVVIAYEDPGTGAIKLYVQ